MEQIYTIPVNEAFESSMNDNTKGCPFCTLFNMLENDEIDLILGASMMEPDVRIRTNEQGFCFTHYQMMMARRNRLQLALILESHLLEVFGKIKGGGMGELISGAGSGAMKTLSKLNEDCYVCGRIEHNFALMIETAVLLWENDEQFRAKTAAQPYFCLPHYERFISTAKARMNKKKFAGFFEAVSKVENAYFEKLNNDVSWFCKKFDYRYQDEPWYDSKDAVERAVKFVAGDLHNPPEDKKSGKDTLR